MISSQWKLEIMFATRKKSSFHLRMKIKYITKINQTIITNDYETLLSKTGAHLNNNRDEHSLNMINPFERYKNSNYSKDIHPSNLSRFQLINIIVILLTVNSVFLTSALFDIY